MSQFVEDAAYRPSVDCGMVLLHSEKDLWGSVPKSNDLMSVLSQRIGINSSKSEVSKFYVERVSLN